MDSHTLLYAFSKRKANPFQNTFLRPTLFTHVCLFCAVFILLNVADSTYLYKQIWSKNVTMSHVWCCLCICLGKKRRKLQEKRNRKLETHALLFKVVVHCAARLLTDPEFVCGFSLLCCTAAGWQMKAHSSVFATI